MPPPLWSTAAVLAFGGLWLPTPLAYSIVTLMRPQRGRRNEEKSLLDDTSTFTSDHYHYLNAKQGQVMELSIITITMTAVMLRTKRMKTIFFGIQAFLKRKHGYRFSRQSEFIGMICAKDVRFICKRWLLQFDRNERLKNRWYWLLQNPIIRYAVKRTTIWSLKWELIWKSETIYLLFLTRSPWR